MFYDIGLNCESQGEKGRTWKNYKIIIGYRLLFLFIHALPFSPGHPLESKGMFLNLFGNYSLLCAMAHPDFGRLSNPISTRGDRLCPHNYYWHTRIFRPSDGPVLVWAKSLISLVGKCWTKCDFEGPHLLHKSYVHICGQLVINFGIKITQIRAL